MKRKTTIDMLAARIARYEKHLQRASAKPALRSGIKGRVNSAPVPVVEKEETIEESE